MTEQTQNRPRGARIGIFVLVSVGFLVVVTALAALMAVRGEIRLPSWAAQGIEARLNAGIEGARVRLGSIGVSLQETGIAPRLRLGDVVVYDAYDVPRAYLPDIELGLDNDALTGGRIRPGTLRVRGGRIAVHRDEDGTVEVGFTGGRDAAGVAGGDGDGAAAGFAAALDLEEVVARVERLFNGEMLGRLRRVEATGLSVFLDDALTGRVWDVEDGRLTLDNRADELAAALSFQFAGRGAQQSSTLLSLSHVKGTPETRLRVQFAGVPAQDIAAQSVALSWLTVLDAPISGALAMEVAADGRFAALNGTLEIGPGALDTAAGMAPTRFRRAKTYFRYDDSKEKLTFDEIVLDSRAAQLRASGHAYLSGRSGRRVEALVGQVRFSEFALDPPGLFAAPAVFTGGALDMRVQLEPLAVDIGQLVLTEAGTRYAASGRVAPGSEGWTVALDLETPSLGRDRLLELWPVGFNPKTRAWLSENVRTIEMRDLTAAFRLQGEAPPRFAITYDFENLAGTYMRQMPLLEDGRGFGVLTDESMNLVLHEGRVTPPEGGAIRLDGSSMTIPDITVRGAPADIRLRTESGLQAALSLLDQEPFRFLSKAGIATDIASGAARADVSLRLPLKDRVTFEDIAFAADGRLGDVRSDSLVRGKSLRAPALSVRADSAGLTVAGSGRLGAVPVEGAWTQPFGPEGREGSRVEGAIELSPRFLDEFGIVLPEGAVSGAGTANVEISLRRDAPPGFALTSDLNRVALSLPALGWRKPPATPGRLEVVGTLGRPAEIERLQIDAPGFSAAGRVALRPDGALDEARFSRVDAGTWFSAGVSIEGATEGGVPRIRVLGGTLDLRAADFGTTGGGGGGDGGGDGAAGPVSLRLDRLIVTDGIALTGVRGEIDGANRLSGRFTAQVNDGPEVAVTLVPSAAGTAARVTSGEGGAVLDAAGLFSGARGGDFSLELFPTGEARRYTGRAEIADIRVVDAPTLAELLSAVSIVGLLDQLTGAGLVFSEVEADLLLAPEAVTIERGSAIGPSMGLSMEGLYDSGRDRLDLQGVITPVYLVNGILEQTRLFGGLFGRDRGEGVFGFNYRLAGPADDPEVTVNPLSVLAPGVFREIFRRPPPRLVTE